MLVPVEGLCPLWLHSSQCDLTFCAFLNLSAKISTVRKWISLRGILCHIIGWKNFYLVVVFSGVKLMHLCTTDPGRARRGGSLVSDSAPYPQHVHIVPIQIDIKHTFLASPPTRPEIQSVIYHSATTLTHGFAPEPTWSFTGEYR